MAGSKKSKSKKAVAKKATAKKTTPRKGGSSTGKVVGVECDMTNWREKLKKSRIKFDDPMKVIYLAELAKHGMKGTAAEAAGVCPRLVRDHLKNDPDFAEKRDRALEKFRDKVISHHHKLLFEGEIHKTYNKDGDLIGEKHVYPIRLIELELKRQEPSYRDKQTIDLHATGGVLVAPAEQTPEDWIKQQEEANAKRAAPDTADGKKAK